MNDELIFINVRESGERIDALLAHNIEDLSRNAAQQLIENSLVLVNTQPVKKNYVCSQNDHIEVTIPELSETPLVAQDIHLDIVYEDDILLVVNKPRGMVVHPAPGHPDSTLVNALMFHCGDSLSGIGGEKRPGIVHRIDKDTSGLIIAAKNDFAHRSLSVQLADHSLSRTYYAVVHGSFRDDSGTVDRPIGRSPNDRKKMAVIEKNGRNAVTHWSVINRYSGYSLVQCKLETGRTHQIRVHMASIGHPLLGDYTYGAKSPDKGLEGQCLHAKKLRFVHPVTGEHIELDSELPDYFVDVLSHLGNKI